MRLFTGKSPKGRRRISNYLKVSFLSLVLTYAGGAVHEPALADAPGLSPAEGDIGLERREQKRINRSMAHYSRARALLLSAIQEFDRARELADPSVLIDPHKWRQGLVDRGKQLERVLAPQARKSGSSVRLPADQRLIGRPTK